MCSVDFFSQLLLLVTITQGESAQTKNDRKEPNLIIPSRFLLVIVFCFIDSVKSLLLQLDIA